MMETIGDAAASVHISASVDGSMFGHPIAQMVSGRSNFPAIHVLD